MTRRRSRVRRHGVLVPPLLVGMLVLVAGCSEGTSGSVGLTPAPAAAAGSQAGSGEGAGRDAATTPVASDDAQGGSAGSPTSVTTTPAASAVASGQPLRFYADPSQQAILEQAADDSERALLSRIADQPQAIWLNGGTWDAATLERAVRASAAEGTVPVVVLYNIPTRDCSQYSAGGAADPSAYLAWVRQLADRMDGRVWVVLEPDGLAASDQCGGATRVRLLHDAGAILRAGGNRVYLDVGNAAWLPATEAASRLRAVGADAFDGIALNVSNYETTADSVDYAERISEAYGSTLHAVVDTSRNGNGPTADHQWCNPPGRALGEAPRAVDEGVLDAVLWVKIPGESDGTCNGGPAAGVFWKSNALELARGAG
ncbi:glycoside hydrolase family 6 protein [Isoptericola sp. b441]|uniref:Glucanase n=1 Tax=Actinotalea lenta TaxID=3064654 RepID=A0ABT9D7Y1_9CELL|nr:glycoside hydrolase family 6 protein [Isoptericola sp. b441]MDO8106223.1 glycoside hydrolase family 6 protein [Isoptericola sp. b441]